MEPKLRQTHEVVIIGAGASGMAAAVVLAEAGADVALLEANDMPGKKLLATGNGKCNFTNSIQRAQCYRGGHPEAAERLLERFDVPYILGFFERLGIPAKQRDGYWYPNSEQAASVREAFALRLAELGVPVYENTHADMVCRKQDEAADKADADGSDAGTAFERERAKRERQSGNFLIAASHRRRLEPGKSSGSQTFAEKTSLEKTKKEKKNGKKSQKPVLSEPFEVWFEAEYLVLAAGGCAGNISGADGSGYALAKGFGHRVIKPVPALVQLRAQKEVLPALSGVRVQAGVLLRICEKKSGKKESGKSSKAYGENGGNAGRVQECGMREYRERGEVLFADYGLSGIPVMQLSRFVAEELAKGEGGGRIEIFLDFFPERSEKELKQMLSGRFAAFPKRTAQQALVGLLPSKLIAALLFEAERSDRGLEKSMAGLEACGMAGAAQEKAGAKQRENGFSSGFCGRLARCMKQFCFEICGTNDFASAQAVAGGVDLDEIDTAAMESKLEEKLYIVGELADIDGTCGGYNLHWAWMSALAAAEGILEKRKGKERRQNSSSQERERGRRA